MSVRPAVTIFMGGLDLTTPALVASDTCARLLTNYEIPPAGGYRSAAGYERFDGRTAPSTSTDATTQATLRAAIQPLPGSGNVLGCINYNGTVYAFRNNVGGTAAVMYRSTSSGWEQVGTPTLNPSGYYQFVLYNFYAQSSSFRVYGCDGANLAFEFGGVFNMASRSRTTNVSTITTATPHGLRSNDTVYITGCSDSSFNASNVTVTVVDSLNFTYANTGSNVSTTADTAGRVSVFSQITTGMGGGQIKTVSRSRTSNVVTITTATPHNLTTGQNVQVSGLSDATFLTTSTACTVTSTTTFTYANTGSNVSTTSDTGGIVYATGATFPKFIAAHAKYLFLAYPGGSLQFSATGDPKNWSVIYNAGEIGVGVDITGLASFKGQYLSIGTTRGISTLTGTGPSSFQLVEYSTSLAALPYGLAEIGGQVTWLNALGLSAMQTAMYYGDFQSSILSKPIDPLYFAQTSSLKFVMVSRKKNQLRLFFANGSVIVCHFNVPNVPTQGFTQPAFTTFLYPTNFVCGFNSGQSGDQMYCGDDQGYVYNMDSGTSFDGAPIYCTLRMLFNHFQSPLNKKRFHRLEMQVDTSQNVALKYAIDYDYSDKNNPSPVSGSLNVSSGGTYWGTGAWGSFAWSVNSIGTAVANIDGSGRNMAIIVNSAETMTLPYTIESALVSYEVRGIQR